jgi:hypothetical protein
MNIIEWLQLGLRDLNENRIPNQGRAIGERRKRGWISSSPGDLPLGHQHQGREGEGGAQGAARGGGTQGQLFIHERLAVFIEEP